MVDSFRLSLLYHFLRFISGMVRVFSGDKYLVKVSGLNYSFIFAQVTARGDRPDRFDQRGGRPWALKR